MTGELLGSVENVRRERVENNLSGLKGKRSSLWCRSSVLKFRFFFFYFLFVCLIRKGF